MRKLAAALPIAALLLIPGAGIAVADHDHNCTAPESINILNCLDLRDLADLNDIADLNDVADVDVEVD
jgi:hypothetical protein